MELIKQYFPELSSHQLEQFGVMMRAYPEWNAKINVISRKDTCKICEIHTWDKDS